jgi:hypothetical protein
MKLLSNQVASQKESGMSIKPVNSGFVSEFPSFQAERHAEDPGEVTTDLAPPISKGSRKHPTTSYYLLTFILEAPSRVDGHHPMFIVQFGGRNPLKIGRICGHFLLRQRPAGLSIPSWCQQINTLQVTNTVLTCLVHGYIALKQYFGEDSSVSTALTVQHRSNLPSFTSTISMNVACIHDSRLSPQSPIGRHAISILSQTYCTRAMVFPWKDSCFHQVKSL